MLLKEILTTKGLSFVDDFFRMIYEISFYVDQIIFCSFATIKIVCLAITVGWMQPIKLTINQYPWSFEHRIFIRLHYIYYSR